MHAMSLQVIMIIAYVYGFVYVYTNNFLILFICVSICYELMVILGIMPYLFSFCLPAD